MALRLIDNSDRKHKLAHNVITQTENLAISSQVVSEVCVNLLKKAGCDEKFVQQLIFDFYSNYSVTPITESIQISASRLRKKYSLSFWDSMICSAAVEMRCVKLLSEDMQDGLVINDQLSIVNPFNT
jgi:predicted nucleic acid-binding protein